MTVQIRSHLPLATALSPLRRAVATRWSSGSRQVSGASCGRSWPGGSGRTTAGTAAELALDESESLRAVLVDVLLVGVGIVAVAAVRISSIAV